MGSRRRALAFLGAVVMAVVLLNAVAYFQAWSMLHFGGARARTKPPERLAWYEKAYVLLVGVDLPRPTNDRSPNASLFTAHRFSTADHVDLEAWWTPHPQDRGVVVLFHGYGATKSALLDEAKAFHDLGFSTLVVDHRGHGGSAGDWTSIGYHEAADVVAAADYVRNDLRSSSPVGFYGQSMGAVSIFRAVSIHETNASALIVEGLYDEMLNAIRNRFGAMGLPSFPLAELLGFWGGVQMGFPAHRHNPVGYAQTITVPVLMLHGSEDPRATREQGRRVFEQLRGKKSFVEFRGLKHQSLYRASSEEWVRTVGTFLMSVAGP